MSSVKEDRREQAASGREAGRGRPLVSVVIPCYNAERTLPAALDSALLQARDVPLEIILVNDGSSDGTGELIDAYAAGKRGAAGLPGGSAPAVSFRVIRHERSGGAARGRNEGVAAASGKYVAFLDADDIWAAGKLKAQVAVMEAGKGKGRPSLCCTARELMTPGGRLTGRVIPVREEISYRVLLRHNSINCSSVLIPVETAREFPMAHEDSHEDYITWMQVVKKYGPAAGINVPYLQYRLTGKGKSGSKLKSARMTYTAYRYAGFGRAAAALLFVRYAAHGVWKYAGASWRGILAGRHAGA